MAGDASAYAWLISAPLLVQEALCNLLNSRLPVSVRSSNEDLESPIGDRLALDLKFGNGLAVADVKYRFAKKPWEPRRDAYQVIAYATHLGTRAAAILNFSKGSVRWPDFILKDQRVRVRHLSWNTDLPAQAAADSLVEQTRAWLAESQSSG